MKTFDQIREGRLDQPDLIDLEEDENLNESLLRKGSGLVFARSSKTFGDKAESHYQRALGILTRPLNTKETEVSRLGDAMTEMLRGNIETRKQLGAMTSLGLVAVLLNERRK